MTVLDYFNVYIKRWRICLVLSLHGINKHYSEISTFDFEFMHKGCSVKKNI
ncbi:hypothetical protein PAHAL_J053400 [Panicum hallii]|uniref:Uncharacterized protein n=1 Tax=Panicum hallii TaxID=206008 RepID=A0A2T7A9Z7_9POAL|nr:hypothetical protein PAHAL_J053400 [Panicum hallii]